MGATSRRGRPLIVLAILSVSACGGGSGGGDGSGGGGGSGGSIVLQVADSGSGMTEEVRRRVMEPFFTTKDPDRGTGLGLAQVHGIIEQHGGTIAVESNVGEGTTFTISLPLAWRSILSGMVMMWGQRGQGQRRRTLSLDQGTRPEYPTRRWAMVPGP